MNLNIADWMMGLGGGLLIGLASALYLLGNGRIARISGLLGGALGQGPNRFLGERFAFFVGLIGAQFVWISLTHVPAITVATSPAILILAGLLVGFGTQMGSGCTSGHGVCGLSRFSPRSAAAVAVFMAVGVLTVALGRHVIGGL